MITFITFCSKCYYLSNVPTLLRSIKKESLSLVNFIGCYFPTKMLKIHKIYIEQTYLAWKHINIYF